MWFLGLHGASSCGDFHATAPRRSTAGAAPPPLAAGDAFSVRPEPFAASEEAQPSASATTRLATATRKLGDPARAKQARLELRRGGSKRIAFRGSSGDASGDAVGDASGIGRGDAVAPRYARRYALNGSVAVPSWRTHRALGATSAPTRQGRKMSVGWCRVRSRAAPLGTTLSPTIAASGRRPPASAAARTRRSARPLFGEAFAPMPSPHQVLA